MAIVPTGAIYKSLVFDGESSRDYGIYITGQAVYNAPERDVEMINIPGRNGSFALDKGRFQNIEVTYPAGIFADNEADFAQGISDFRNFLCSRNGYVRLADDYNPDEYRMAVYKSGLDVSPAQLKAGEFQITFNCKPQRFLTSGEEAIDVDSGDTITNPTLFESSPMLEVEGTGNIVIGEDTITVEDELIGEVPLTSGTKTTTSATLNTANLNSGDSIYTYASPRLEFKLVYGSGKIEAELTTISGGTGTNYTKSTGGVINIVLNISNPSFVYGTSASQSVTAGYRVILNNSTATTATFTFTATYNGSTGVTLSWNASGLPSGVTRKFVEWIHPVYYGNSSKSAVPMPLYIDLDIGEAWGELGGEMVNLNNIVSLPASLPKLAAGDTEITYSNTITDLKLIPRWWKI